MKLTRAHLAALALSAVAAGALLLEPPGDSPIDPANPAALIELEDSRASLGDPMSDPDGEMVDSEAISDEKVVQVPGSKDNASHIDEYIATHKVQLERELEAFNGSSGKKLTLQQYALQKLAAEVSQHPVDTE